MKKNVATKNNQNENQKEDYNLNLLETNFFNRLLNTL